MEINIQRGNQGRKGEEMRILIIYIINIKLNRKSSGNPQNDWEETKNKNNQKPKINKKINKISIENENENEDEKQNNNGNQQKERPHTGNKGNIKKKEEYQQNKYKRKFLEKNISKKSKPKEGIEAEK